MTNVLLHLRIVGASLLALSVAHVFVGRHLQWKTDTARLTLVNRQIFYVHTCFICLSLAMLGTLCLFFAPSLLERTSLGRLVLVCLVIFWATRLLFQWFVYDWSLWRGHRTNTIIHFAATILWSYYTLIFAKALCRQW